MRIELVGHTIPQSGKGGASLGISKVIYKIGKEYVKKGHDVELLIRDDIKPKEKWVKTVYAPKFSWFAYPFYISPKLYGIKADVFHSDYVTTGMPLVVCGKRPCVVSVHDVYPMKEKPERGKEKIGNLWWKTCFKIVKKADALILMSEHARKQAISYGCDSEKTFAVHNGIDTKKFRKMRRKKHDKLRIGYFGGLDGRKNVKLLVDAFEELVKKHDVELHVGGTGHNLGGFKARRISNTKFYGHVPDRGVVAFYNSLDLFVFPTLGEGFGFPPLEAMACGTPVLAANTSSMPEVVGNAGMLFEPNRKSLVEAVESVMDSTKLKAMSKKGIKRAKEFSWKKCAENTLKVYEAVIK